jgi:hypothetical protein
MTYFLSIIFILFYYFLKIGFGRIMFSPIMKCFIFFTADAENVPL